MKLDRRGARKEIRKVVSRVLEQYRLEACDIAKLASASGQTVSRQRVNQIANGDVEHVPVPVFVLVLGALGLDAELTAAMLKWHAVVVQAPPARYVRRVVVRNSHFPRRTPAHQMFRAQIR